MKNRYGPLTLAVSAQPPEIQTPVRTYVHMHDSEIISLILRPNIWVSQAYVRMYLHNNYVHLYLELVA